MNDDYTIGHGAFHPYLNKSLTYSTVNPLNIPEVYKTVFKKDFDILYNLLKQSIFQIFENSPSDYVYVVKTNNHNIHFCITHWIRDQYVIVVDTVGKKFSNFDTAFDYWIEQIRK